MILDELRKELKQEKDKIDKIWDNSKKRVNDLKIYLKKEVGNRYDYFKFSSGNYGVQNAKLVKCPQCDGEGKLPVYSLKATLENTQEYIECDMCSGKCRCYFIYGFDNDFRDWKHDAVC